MLFANNIVALIATFMVAIMFRLISLVSVAKFVIIVITFIRAAIAANVWS